MSEGKDPAIKLFGKTIQLPEISPDCGSGGVSQDVLSGDGGGSGDGGSGDGGGVKSEDRSFSSSSSSEANSKGVGEERELDDDNKDVPDEKSIDKEEERAHSTISEEITNPNTTSALNENPKTLSTENESATAKTSKSDEEQSDPNNSNEKTLKKPDKILPCPRCNSMDTKFCYYNNYNVNQPRHFCKNCQRYWTAGGTMRNVPVGAGRRKNKTSAAQYRQITVTEPLSGEPNHPVLNPNGTVLTFGSDTPLCESMASVLQIADKTMMQDGFRKPEELRITVPLKEDDSKLQNCHGFSPQVPCFPGAPWPYPWNPQMGPGYGPPGFPMPFYPPPPYWGCAVPVPVSVPGPGPGPWNVQWVHPQPAFQPAPFSGPISPTLGKHSRDESMKLSNGVEEEPTKENEPEKSLWVPKTLRIDDPDEAAKSSIWATLGINNDRSVGVNGGGMFKAFQSKGEEKNAVREASPALQANPAALSRSINFRETS